MPLFKQRFREMKGGASLAQHDRKQICCDKKQLLCLFSVGATIGRPLFCLFAAYLFLFHAKRPHLSFRA